MNLTWMTVSNKWWKLFKTNQIIRGLGILFLCVVKALKHVKFQNQSCHHCRKNKTTQHAWLGSVSLQCHLAKRCAPGPVVAPETGPRWRCAALRWPRLGTGAGSLRRAPRRPPERPACRPRARSRAAQRRRASSRSSARTWHAQANHTSSNCWRWF